MGYEVEYLNDENVNHNLRFEMVRLDYLQDWLLKAEIGHSIVYASAVSLPSRKTLSIEQQTIVNLLYALADAEGPPAYQLTQKRTACVPDARGVSTMHYICTRTR